MESFKNNEVIKRWKSETPSFWKKVQRIGLIAGGLGAVIIASPIALPAAIVSIGGYLTLAGSVAATLSQLTVEDKEVLD
jgi:hypothetical protein